MVGLDTNVLVRFLVNDDKKQADAVNTFITDALARCEKIFISSVCLLETVWVLDSVFRFSRDEIVNILDDLLSRNGFEIQDEPVVHEAYLRFRRGKADFADYFSALYALRKCGKPLLTFDKSCSEKDLFEQLKY